MVNKDEYKTYAVCLQMSPYNAMLVNSSSSVALALQEFSVTFKYRAGRNNVAADCLSRLK